MACEACRTKFNLFKRRVSIYYKEKYIKINFD